jgi:AraC-like DNA-binding protein
VVAQEGRETALKPGDFTLFDARRSYRLAYEDRYSAVFVLLPPKLLPFSQKRLEQVEMVPVLGQQGLGALVATFLTRLAKEAESLDGHDAARVSDNLLDLLAMAFAQRLDCASDIPAATRGKALCTQVKYYIEQHLDDPRLAPAAIAAAHYISTRYLQKVFERDDITVTGLIRTRRLEKIRKDLANPLLDDRPVAEVGARWGLVNPSQVSRLFRDAFGISPREYRAIAATGRATDAA